MATATLGNVRAQVRARSGPNCNVDLGAPTGAFTSADTGTVDPGVVDTTYGVWNVKAGNGGTATFCISPRVWSQGDRSTWNATWKITADTAAYNPIAIN